MPNDIDVTKLTDLELEELSVTLETDGSHFSQDDENLLHEVLREMSLRGIL